MKTKPSINQVLARRLREAMGEMTQATLAKGSGIDQKTISNYLNAGRRPTGKTGKEASAKLTELARIADYLGVEVWQLLCDGTPQDKNTQEFLDAAYRLVKEGQGGISPAARAIATTFDSITDERQRAVAEVAVMATLIGLMSGNAQKPTRTPHQIDQQGTPPAQSRIPTLAGSRNPSK